MAGRRLPLNGAHKDHLMAALETAEQAAQELSRLLNAYEGLAERRKALQALENRSDQHARTAIEALTRRRLASPRRDRAMELVRSVHRITNAAYAVSNRLFVYGISKATPEMVPFAEILLSQTRALRQAAAQAETHQEAAERHVHEVRSLERKADAHLNDTLAALFRRPGDALSVVKHKEVYEVLENATDRCEDAADALAWLLWAP